jgi:hypothetical protein
MTLSEYPFLLTPDTLPVNFASDGTTPATHPLWNAPAGAPVIRQVIIDNPVGNPTFYIAVGPTSAVAATNANKKIYAGTCQTFSIREDNRYFSALSASGQATIDVTPGSGE